MFFFSNNSEVKKAAKKVIAFPKSYSVSRKMTFHPQFLNISPEIILILQNMSFIYIFIIDCCESQLRTFCRQIHQCANFGNTKAPGHSTPP